MKVIKKIGKVLLIMIMAVVIVTAIALNYETVLASHKNKTIVAAASDITSLEIPENVSVVGLGEATHGNIEFQELKLDIFKILVEKYDYRAFALEADFGDCLEANEYIQGADGDARDIVNNMAFPMYHTRQMADILDWMKDYNSKVSEDKRLRFYGFDMQNPEKCVEQLHKFLANYNLTTIDTSGLDYLVDLTRTKALSDDDINKVYSELSELKKAIEPMKSDNNDVNIIYGLKLVENIETCFNYLFLDDAEKYNARDILMADNVEWILNLEEEIGSGKIMLGAHDSHISKKGNSSTRISMGGELKNRLGDSYYSLGSDFFKGSDNSRVNNMFTEDYKRKNFYMTTADPIAYQAKYMDDKRFLLDFSSVSESENKELYDLIHSEVSMGDVGEGFADFNYFLHSAYRLKASPADQYDGMIFYYNVKPIAPQF